jgi:ribosomal protein L11 methyltransferase
MKHVERNWSEFSVRADEQMATGIGNRLLDLGAQGLILDDGDIIGEHSLYDGEERITTVKTYFPAETAGEIRQLLDTYIESLKSLFPESAEPEVTVKTLEGEDWAHTWKRFFKPTEVAKGVVVKPTWEAYTPKGDELIIELDPGLAFGTGQHNTTRLCIDAIRRFASHEELMGARRISHNALDVGTGSGILAILAAKVGIPRVVAIDNDPIAVEVAQENVDLNKVDAHVTVLETPLEQLDETFDLVIANILAETLIDMREALMARLNVGGYLILSGILRNKASDVRVAYMHGKMDFVESNNDEDWTSLVFRRT